MDKGLAFYCSLVGKDTVYSIVLTWYKTNEGIQRIFDGKTRTTNLLAVYNDSFGNPVMTISEVHTPGESIKKAVSYAEIKYAGASRATDQQVALQGNLAEPIPPPIEKTEPDVPASTTPVSDTSGVPNNWDDAPGVVEAPRKEIDFNKVFEDFELDERPVFQNGDADYFQFIQANLQYPAAAKAKNIQGTVYVSFIIEKDGSVANIEIKRDIGGGCGAEVVRVLQLMPKWKPGHIQGQAVRVRETRPIRFKL